MNHPILTIDTARPLEPQAKMLSRTLRDERAGHALSGYWFEFGEGESCSHAKTCPAFEWSCYEMVRCARDERKAIEIFKNMNGQIACRRIDP